MKDLVILENNQALTTSRIVAEHFDKNHRDVLRAIEDLKHQISTAQFCALFNQSNYKASNGKTNPMYLMTRDGFSLLAMGFTGKKALQFKLKFIDAFNRMEAQLKTLAFTDRDPRWIETRQLGKKTRKLLTRAIKALEDYFLDRGKTFPEGYLYGHLTNIIQNALCIEKGCRDFCSVKKLNQLDQSEDITGKIILRAVRPRPLGLGI